MHFLHAILVQQNVESRSLSDTSHALEISDKEGGSCRHRILSAFNLCARPRKLQKYYIFFMEPQKHLD